MKISMKLPVVAVVVSSALAGAAGPALADYYNNYYRQPAPGAVYVDPMPTGSVYMEPVPMGGPYGYVYRPPAQSLGDERERYTNEYWGGGEGDYYQGIAHPAPVP
ncbi:MAG TPA: hypothetical protein VGO04_22525 [Ensifer sp.]|jgi:hypothetical protein|uniref:hypothetical protein n=1 Tax=Ensifer sp. TaxID=1872086 RepID=UPI002E1346A5|nr:hypothetical protein [Ensifer sp.]